MKKLLVLLSFLLILPANAQNYNVVCPSESLSIIEKENFFNKITGLNFASKKIVELAIQKVLNDEFYKSNIDAKLNIFNINRLKNGEFAGLSIKSKNLIYRALRMTNFYAQTVCSYNKITQLNKKVYFPIDLPFKFEGTITNLDIQNVLNSEEFQRELKKISILETPTVVIENGFLNFTIPIKNLFSSKPIKVKFRADIAVENNKIVLRNITFNSKSNIINNDILAPLLGTINPIAYEVDVANGKFCKLLITRAIIQGNEIKTNGVLVINKNIGEGNE